MNSGIGSAGLSHGGICQLPAPPHVLGPHCGCPGIAQGAVPRSAARALGAARPGLGGLGHPLWEQCARAGSARGGEQRPRSLASCCSKRISGLVGLPMKLHDIIMNNNKTLYNLDTNIFQWFNVQCPRLFGFWFLGLFVVFIVFAVLWCFPSLLGCSALLLFSRPRLFSSCLDSESSAGTDVVPSHFSCFL